MIIYYDHKRRACFREDKGNHSLPITMADAKEAAETGQVEDCNIAFNRLVEHDFDTDKVEAYYVEMHKLEEGS